jgi:hypothetical protein
MEGDSQESWRGYGAPKDVMPLGGYGVLVGIFGAGLAGFLAWAARNRRLPHRLGLRDALLLGVGTHKLTRIVTKDFVTSPARALFVEFKGSSLPGEVVEKSRGHGLRRAVGDLLTCEFCIAPWIAGGLLATHAVDPRVSRFLAGLFATVAISDFLNHAYTAAAKRAQAGG